MVFEFERAGKVIPAGKSDSGFRPVSCINPIPQNRLTEQVNRFSIHRLK